MRILLTLLLLNSIAARAAICDTVPIGAPQLFGAKLYEFKNYALIDSFLMIASGDTSSIPFYPSIKYKTSDNRWYATFPYHWDRFLIGSDTANKWVQNIYSRNDSLFKVKNAIETFLNNFEHYMFDNGLTNNSGVIQFGQSISAIGNPGALIHNTEIPLSGFNTVFTGNGTIGIGTNNPNAFSKLDVLSTSINTAVRTTSDSGAAISGTSNGNGIVGSSNHAGRGVQGNSNGGIGVEGLGGIGGIGGRFTTVQAGNTSTPVVLELQRDPTGGGVTNGAGFTVMFRNPFSNGTSGNESGRIVNYFSNATAGSQSSAFEWWLADNAVSARRALLSHTGQWTWDGYPSLTAQTDSATYKPLGIDGSGNVARMANWFGAGGSGTATLNYKNVGFGGIGNTLSPGEAAFQYDSITNKLRVDSIDMVQSRMDSAFMIRLSPYVSSDTLVANGNSITYGLNASPITDSAYAYQLAERLGLKINNLGVSSTGMVSIANRSLINVNPGNKVMQTVMGGLNDIRANGIDRKTLNKIINGYKSIFANQYMKSYTNAGTGGINVTRYGSWTNSWNAQAEGGKTTVGAYTSTTNDSITYTFADSTVIVGLMGGDGSVASLIGTDIEVYIDGTLNSTINTNNQTDGVTEGAGFSTHRCPMAFFFGGLTYGPHEIKLVKKSTGGGGYMICDYFGHFKRSDSTNLMLWFHAPYLNNSGYSGTLANDARIDTLNSKIDSLATTPFVKWYTTFVVKTNTCYDTLTGISIDNVHPNNTGHTQICNCGINKINSINGGGSTTGKIYYTDQFHGVVEGQDDIFLMLSKGDKKYIQNQNTTVQSANYNINGSGTATKFITTGGVFGVMTNPTTDRQINGFSAGTVSGLAFMSLRNNGGAADNKSFDWFAGSRTLNYRILSDDLTTAIDYLQIIRSNGAMGVDSIKFPVGKLYVENVPVASNVDSVLAWDRTSGEIRYAKINGTGITSINGQTGPAISIAAGNDIDVATTTNTVTIGVKVSDQVLTSGTSVTINNGVKRLFVDPASALASLTITFPSSPDDGQQIKIFFGGTINSASSDVVTGGITSWTASPGSFVPNLPVSPTPIKAGTLLIFEYRASGTYWYQVK